MPGKKGSTHARIVLLNVNGKLVEGKRCNKCLNEKPLSDFYKAPRGIGNRRPKCISCMAPTGRKIMGLSNIMIEGALEKVKECKSCGKSWPLSNFYKGKGAGGVASQCKICLKETSRQVQQMRAEEKLIKKKSRFTRDNNNKVRLNPSNHSEIVGWTSFKGKPEPIIYCNSVSLNYFITTKEGYSAIIPFESNLQRVLKQTRYLQETEWVPIHQLKPIDKIRIRSTRDSFYHWSGDGNFEQGWLLGEILGDGGLRNDHNHAYVSFWGNQKHHLSSVAVSRVHRSLDARTDFVGNGLDHRDLIIVRASGLTELAKHFGLDRVKEITPRIEMASSHFYCGLLRGLFDSDGSVQGEQRKGISIRLNQSDLKLLQAVQRMLLRLGIYSVIYPNRRTSDYRELPDGKGGRKLYFCQDNHELVIANDNLYEFKVKIGFEDLEKSARLQKGLESYKRELNRCRFIATVDKIITVTDRKILLPNGATEVNGIVIHY